MYHPISLFLFKKTTLNLVSSEKAKFEVFRRGLFRLFLKFSAKSTSMCNDTYIPSRRYVGTVQMRPPEGIFLCAKPTNNQDSPNITSKSLAKIVGLIPTLVQVQFKR